MVKYSNAQLEFDDYEVQKKKHEDECRRLRMSREACVRQERKFQDDTKTACQYIFTKVKSFLHDNKKVEDVKLLHCQVKGTRETLELLAKTENIQVLEKMLADLYAREEMSMVFILKNKLEAIHKGLTVISLAKLMLSS